MKKRSYTNITKVVKSIFNVSKWSDFDRIKAFSRYLGNAFKVMFTPQKKTTGETFEKAVTDYNLDEKDLLIQQKALFRLSLLMCVLAALIFMYAVYHVIYGSISAVIISVVVMLIALTLAFRYHFWYFQIKERKLGCSFKEWFRQGLLGEKP